MTTADVDITKPPFVVIDGVFNARAVGGYELSDGKHVKDNIFFRAGELSSITPDGVKTLRDDLGIRQIFDTRSDAEIAGYKAKELNDVEGVGFERIQLDVLKNHRFEPVGLAERLKLLETDEFKTFTSMAMEVVDTLGPAFEKMIRYMNDHPTEPPIIHCTAGKDRTGLTTAVLLALLGVPDDAIGEEYGLTAAGIAPASEMLANRLMMIPVFAQNPAGTLVMGNCKPAYVKEVLRIIRGEHGGLEDFLKARTGLSDQNIETFKTQFVI
ncbi:protein-tyrosine phosphatase-like protein [Flagelloscypha sp. PMI_526]|nr:protein-tyrosine phosphatase-like protein [Flagelloscypha sp. PMI_526]